MLKNPVANTIRTLRFISILHINDWTSFSFVVILSKRVSMRYLKFGRSGIITFSVKDDIDAK